MNDRKWPAAVVGGFRLRADRRDSSEATFSTENTRVLADRIDGAEKKL